MNQNEANRLAATITKAVVIRTIEIEQTIHDLLTGDNKDSPTFRVLYPAGL